jgi:hypothetical protein
MTIEKWYGPSHVALAAVRAAAANTSTYATTYWTADPFITAGIPTTPTSYGANGAPNDGGYYMREMESADTPRIMPFAEFWIDGQPTPTEQMDGEATIYEVRLGIRVRVGGQALAVTGTAPNTVTTTTGAQLAALHARAMSMCRLIQIVTAEYIRGAALIYDSAGALGICYTGTPSPPSLDTGSAAPTDGNGVVSADAVAFIPVFQRLYDPAGVNGVSL